MIRPDGIYDRSVVLLSGGFDSTAALHWVMENRRPLIHAVAYDYGQPHRDAELSCAQRLAERWEIPFTRLRLTDLPRLGLLASVTDHNDAATGTNPAFVPGRNMIFLSVAGGFAATQWPTGNLNLVIGACPDDIAGFPDCRPGFLSKMGEALRAGLGREVRIVTPYIDRSKAMVLAMYARDTDATADLVRSWSCYRGASSGPCGTCSACVVRARAFAEAGVVDESAYPKMTGGDPHREAK